MATIGLGLASRHGAPKDIGDVLYATMAFWLVGLLAPRWTAAKRGWVALAYCYVIEAAKWIPAMRGVRHSVLGHLVFGTAFQASNLVCYAIGVGLAVALELLFHRRCRSRPDEAADHAV